MAERLLKVVETLLASPRRAWQRAAEQGALVAVHERLWQLRHPDAGGTLRLSYGRPHDDGLPTARTAPRPTGWVRVLVICNSCRHQADADLQGDRRVWPR